MFIPRLDSLSAFASPKPLLAPRMSAQLPAKSGFVTSFFSFSDCADTAFSIFIAYPGEIGRVSPGEVLLRGRSISPRLGRECSAFPRIRRHGLDLSVWHNYPANR